MPWSGGPAVKLESASNCTPSIEKLLGPATPLAVALVALPEPVGAGLADVEPDVVAGGVAPPQPASGARASAVTAATSRRVRVSTRWPFGARSRRRNSAVLALYPVLPAGAVPELRRVQVSVALGKGGVPAELGERDKLGEAKGASRLTRPLGEYLPAASPGGGVGGRGVAGEGFGTGSGVALEGAHGGVSGPGEQHRGVGAALGVVGQRGMAQLVRSRTRAATFRASGRTPLTTSALTTGTWAGGTPITAALV